jgi:tetratricopeptide (TPR) repeat protein
MKIYYITLTFLALITSGCNQIDVKASIEKTKLLIKDRKLAEADREITPCLPAAVNSPQIYVLAALAKATKENNADFLSIIEQAQAAFADSTDDKSLTLLARACIEANELEKAISFLEQSLAINPDDLYTVTLLIHTEFTHFGPKLRSYSMNNKYLKKATRFEALKNSVQYYNLQAITQVVNPRFNSKTDRIAVEQKLMKAMALDSKNPATLLNLAVVYDVYFQKKKKAHGLYGLYLKAVKLLPPDNTQADKVQRRMTLLQSEI